LAPELPKLLAFLAAETGREGENTGILEDVPPVESLALLLFLEASGLRLVADFDPFGITSSR